MSTDFQVDGKQGVILARTSGETSSDELLENLAALLAHPEYGPAMRLLLDMRRVTPSLLRGDVLRIAGFIRDHRGEIGALRVAVVVPGEASFGMAQEQKVELDESPVDMEVFRSMREAREWLGLPRDGVPTTDADAVAG